jgi:hypothetical protein
MDGKIRRMNQAMSPAHMSIVEVSFGVGLLRYPRLGRLTGISMPLQERLTIGQEFIENKGETREEATVNVTPQKADVRTGILSSPKFAPVFDVPPYGD